MNTLFLYKQKRIAWEMLRSLFMEVANDRERKIYLKLMEVDWIKEATKYMYDICKIRIEKRIL